MFWISKDTIIDGRATRFYTVRGTELRVRPTNLKTRWLPQFWPVNRPLAYFFNLCFRWAQMKDNTSMSTDERQYFDEHRWKTILRCLYLHIWIPKPSIRWETSSFSNNFSDCKKHIFRTHCCWDSSCVASLSVGKRSNASSTVFEL